MEPTGGLRATFSGGLSALLLAMSCGGEDVANQDDSAGAGGAKMSMGGEPETASGGMLTDSAGGGTGGVLASTGGAGAVAGTGGESEVEDSLSLGCTDGSGVTEGEVAISSGGRERKYVVSLPSTLSSDQPWPLVLALHPNNGNLNYWLSNTSGRDLESEMGESAVVVHLEAIDGQWRNYDLDVGELEGLLEEELVYVDDVMNQVLSELCIDQNRIFSLGFSGGGSFSGVLSCRRDDIRAFAAGGAVIYFKEDDCIGDSAAWIQIGETDVNAGREDFRDWFRERSGCTASSVPTTPGSCVAYDACNAERPVVYCEPVGLGHEVPDFFADAAWGFFQSFE